MKRYIFIYLLIVTTCVMSFIFSENNYCEEPMDVWFRSAPKEDGSGEMEILKLDMSTGYAYSDGFFIYLLVEEMNTGEKIVIAFYNDEYWNAETSHWRHKNPAEQEEPPKTLKEYLRLHKDRSYEIEKLDK